MRVEEIRGGEAGGGGRSWAVMRGPKAGRGGGGSREMIELLLHFNSAVHLPHFLVLKFRPAVSRRCGVEAVVRGAKAGAEGGGGGKGQATVTSQVNTCAACR